MKGVGELFSGLTTLIYVKSALHLALPSVAVCESMRWIDRDNVIPFLRRALRGMECQQEKIPHIPVRGYVKLPWFIEISGY